MDQLEAQKAALDRWREEKKKVAMEAAQAEEKAALEIQQARSARLERRQVRLNPYTIYKFPQTNIYLVCCYVNHFALLLFIFNTSASACVGSTRLSYVRPRKRR